MCHHPRDLVFLMPHFCIWTLHSNGEFYLKGFFGKYFFFVWDTKSYDLLRESDGCKWTVWYDPLYLRHGCVFGSFPCMRSSIDEDMPSRPLFGGALLVLDANEPFPIRRSMVGKSNEMPFDCIFFLPCGFYRLVGRGGPDRFRLMDFMS